MDKGLIIIQFCVSLAGTAFVTMDESYIHKFILTKRMRKQGFSMDRFEEFYESRRLGWSNSYSWWEKMNACISATFDNLLNKKTWVRACCVFSFLLLYSLIPRESD